MPRRGPGLSDTSTDEAMDALWAYHEALGSFVSAFARTEGLMHLTLRLFSGVRDDIGSALLSGFRADQVKDLLNRILDATGRQGVKSTLQRHFQQFGVITKIRNDILHYGAEFETPDMLVISNERDAHIPERLRETRITPRDLRRMNIDLHVIRSGLLAVIDDLMPSDNPGKAKEISQQAWQYIPPPQVPPANSSRKTRPARSRPPSSSQH